MKRSCILFHPAKSELPPDDLLKLVLERNTKAFGMAMLEEGLIGTIRTNSVPSFEDIKNTMTVLKDRRVLMSFGDDDVNLAEDYEGLQPFLVKSPDGPTMLAVFAEGDFKNKNGYAAFREKILPAIIKADEAGEYIEFIKALDTEGFGKDLLSGTFNQTGTIAILTDKGDVRIFTDRDANVNQLNGAFGFLSNAYGWGKKTAPTSVPTVDKAKARLENLLGIKKPEAKAEPEKTTEAINDKPSVSNDKIVEAKGMLNDNTQITIAPPSNYTHHQKVDWYRMAAGLGKKEDPGNAMFDGKKIGNAWKSGCPITTNYGKLTPVEKNRYAKELAADMSSAMKVIKQNGTQSLKDTTSHIVGSEVGLNTDDKVMHLSSDIAKQAKTWAEGEDIKKFLDTSSQEVYDPAAQRKWEEKYPTMWDITGLNKEDFYKVLPSALAKLPKEALLSLLVSIRADSVNGGFKFKAKEVVKEEPVKEEVKAEPKVEKPKSRYAM